MLAAEIFRVWPWYSLSPLRLPDTMMSTPWLPKMRCRDATSASRGTLSRTSVFSVRRLAIISGSAAFLAPEIGIVPCNGRPPTMRMRSMSPHLLEPAPAALVPGAPTATPLGVTVWFVGWKSGGIGSRRDGGVRALRGRPGLGPPLGLRLAAPEVFPQGRAQPGAAGRMRGGLGLGRVGHGSILVPKTGPFWATGEARTSRRRVRLRRHSPYGKDRGACPKCRFFLAVPDRRRAAVAQW